MQGGGNEDGHKETEEDKERRTTGDLFGMLFLSVLKFSHKHFILS